jgi:hypothetical protein
MSTDYKLEADRLKALIDEADNEADEVISSRGLDPEAGSPVAELLDVIRSMALRSRWEPAGALEALLRDERLACARIAARECACGEPFERCHVAQETLLAREAGKAW